MSKEPVARGIGPLRPVAGRAWARDFTSRKEAGLAGEACRGTGPKAGKPTVIRGRGAKTIRVRQSSFFFFDVASVLPSELPNSTDRTCMLLDKKTNKIRCFPVLDTAFSPDQSLETLQTLKPCKEHCPTKLATWSSSSPLRQLQDIREEIMFINDFPKMVAGAKGDCVPTAKDCTTRFPARVHTPPGRVVSSFSRYSSFKDLRAGETMGSRSQSEDQSTFDPNYSPPNTVDFATQEVLAALAAEAEVGDHIASQEAGVTQADGKQKGSRKRLISLVDDTDDSDVEISQPTQKTKPRRQTSFGTATGKPMLQSTIDGGVGSSAQVCSKGKSVPMKSVIRGGRRKSPTKPKKKKVSPTQSQKKKEKWSLEQPAASRNVMLHSFLVQPAGRLVRACEIMRYGTGPAFSGPQPARDGTAWTREMLSPRRVGTGLDGTTCLTKLNT
ncbi:hypothetical protein IGI04_030503 [Brassica rapa subsp. trilocularis]|uniref:Uncharacterized protein n=1 Tax=Brassica rapa subsp. trilocularis TaxID=1813537 RepID=A0ABQ7LRS3_BRACM|nr:hypothetical protein IGI04_030503 [Brassica rapa subsp. trilocularis]